MENIGKIIGNYLIKSKIAEGGMAKVYLGEHQKLGKKTAIKILNPILSVNQDIRERFIKEAKFMAELEHENIVEIIDLIEEDGNLAIVMELLEGNNLNDLIAENKEYSKEQTLNYFRQVLAAFIYAHDKGLVHRDIKPSNIFLHKNKTIKVFDFGIAKLFGTGLDQTKTGTQMGTPIYMSPEQVKGDKSLDHRSDIYSLGVTLYFLLSGKPPYDEVTSSGYDLMTKILKEPFPTLVLDSNLNEIIQKATTKDRNLRFQSCEEFLFAISSNETKSFEDKTKNKNHEDKNKSDKGHIITDSNPKKPNKQLKKLMYLFLSVVLILMAIVIYTGSQGPNLCTCVNEKWKDDKERKACEKLKTEWINKYESASSIEKDEMVKKIENCRNN